MTPATFPLDPEAYIRLLSRYIECVRAGPALLQKAQLLYSEVGRGRLNQMRKQALSEVVKRNQEQSHTRMLRKITGVTSLTKEEVHRLHDAFDLKRKRNTMAFGAETPWEERVIDFSGFEELMRHEMPQFNGDAEMLKNLFNAFDDDRSGFVDEQEFIVGLSTLIASADVEDSANTDAKLRMCFQTADSSNDGRVGREELVKLLESCHKLVSRNAGDRPRPVAVAAVSCHNIAAVWVAFSSSGLHSSQDGSDIVVDRSLRPPARPSTRSGCSRPLTAAAARPGGRPATSPRACARPAALERAVPSALRATSPPSPTSRAP